MRKKLSRQFMPGMRDQSLAAETRDYINTLIVKNVRLEAEERVYTGTDFADFENEVAACIRTKLNA